MTRTSTIALVGTLALAAPAFGQTASDTDAAKTAKGCVISFEVSDEDGNGRISKDEWAKWREQQFGALDADGNGEVSRSEYMYCTYTPKGGSSEAVASGGNGSESSDAAGGSAAVRTRNNMAEADTDRSGSVSRDEYRQAAQHAKKNAEASGGILVLRRYVLVPDSISDDDLSSMSGSETAARSARTFSGLDRDQSGDLNEEEWSTRNAELSDSMANSYGQEFDRMDSDQSGSVSEDEFTAAGDAQWDRASKAAMGEDEASEQTTAAPEASDSSAEAADNGMQADSGSEASGSEGRSASNEAGSGSTQPDVFYLFVTPSNDRS